MFDGQPRIFDRRVLIHGDTGVVQFESQILSFFSQAVLHGDDKLTPDEQSAIVDFLVRRTAVRDLEILILDKR